MRHQRPRVRFVCHSPLTAWCRLAALTACSEQLFVQSTANWVVNSQTCSLYCCSQQPSVILSFSCQPGL